jgi:CRP-like cAMP-binding protein
LDPVVDHLSSLGVFDGASRVALERVAADLGAEEHQPGKVVIRQGDRPDDLYIVLDGTFDVYDGDRRINGVGPGEWFGEIGLLQQRARTASVVAATTATVWRIPGETFLSALQDMASEPTALMDVMAERTQQRGPA